MLKRFLQVFIFVFLVCTAATVFASEIKELKVAPGNLPTHKNSGTADRVLCIDGLKVFQTIAFGAGNGYGAAVSNIQLYEEKDGQVVPVRCE